MKTCQFCNYFEVEPLSSVNSPWLEDEKFCAIASKGAMIPGWSLICPKEHRVNLADMYGQKSLWQFADEARNLIESRYGPVSIFEHGAGYGGSPTGCGTDHAHLHIVPLTFNLIDSSLLFDVDLTWVSCTASEISLHTHGGEYLFVATQMNGKSTLGMLAILEQPVSQFFRRVIANELGIGSKYDYKLHPMWNIAESTASELREDAQARISSQLGESTSECRNRISA